MNSLKSICNPTIEFKLLKRNESNRSQNCIKILKLILRSLKIQGKYFKQNLLKIYVWEILEWVRMKVSIDTFFLKHPLDSKIRMFS